MLRWNLLSLLKTQEFEVRTGDEMMSLDLVEVSQCVLPGNNRNEVELQFPESDAIEANNDQLVSIRFYIPPDPEVDPSDRTVKSSAELLQQRIMQMANIRKTTGDVIGTLRMPFEHVMIFKRFECQKLRNRFIEISSHILYAFSLSHSQPCFPTLFTVEFDLEKGSFLTPRGRYSIELCTYNVYFHLDMDHGVWRLPS